MHEIERAAALQDEIDLAEIEALEEQSRLDDDLTAHLAQEDDVRRALAEASAELQKVLDASEEEAVALRERGENARQGIPDAVLARYARLRDSDGVAVAKLAGRMCEGCHLDLSAAEVDEVKEAAAASGVTDCPQCGRMLVP